MRLLPLLCCLFVCCFLVGCDAKDGAAVSLNLRELNWQTGALIALAYVANSRGHLSGVAKIAQELLRGLKILPAANSKESLSAEDAAKILAELFVRLQGHPQLQEQVLLMMKPPEPSMSSGVTDARR